MVSYYRVNCGRISEFVKPMVCWTMEVVMRAHSPPIVLHSETLSCTRLVYIQLFPSKLRSYWN
jgi:hypothetical protein